MPRAAALPNLSPARLDIDTYRGDTLRLRVQLRARGRAVDVHGWLFNAEVRATPDGAKLGVIDVIPVNDGKLGVLQLTLTPDQSALFPEYSVWDLESVDSRDRVRTLLRGGLTVVADVTRSGQMRSGR